MRLCARRSAAPAKPSREGLPGGAEPSASPRALPEPPQILVRTTYETDYQQCEERRRVWLTAEGRTPEDLFRAIRGTASNPNTSAERTKAPRPAAATRSREQALWQA
ncbi:hypothetical protein GCM10009741_16340 [Kribbella lupini]|uniref:Uncharacterized protein n=1 Tax=Kribbella lupini TaxID=291602 RepID=A0ABN2AEM2_9ACTN